MVRTIKNVTHILKFEGMRLAIIARHGTLYAHSFNILFLCKAKRNNGYTRVRASMLPDFTSFQLSSTEIWRTSVFFPPAKATKDAGLDTVTSIGYDAVSVEVAVTSAASSA